MSRTLSFIGSFTPSPQLTAAWVGAASSERPARSLTGLVGLTGIQCGATRGADGPFLRPRELLSTGPNPSASNSISEGLSNRDGGRRPPDGLRVGQAGL